MDPLRSALEGKQFSLRSISVVLSALLVACAGYIYLRCYFRLRHIPGPWQAATSPAWLFYQTCRGEKHLAIQRLLNEYGPLARISIDQLITDDPDLFKLMNSSSTLFSRGRWYDAIKPDVDKVTVFSARDKAVHTALKAKLSPGYSGKDGIDFERAIDPVVQDLLSLIRENYCVPHRSFDFAPLPGYFTMDSLAKIAFGKEIGYLKRNEDVYQYFKQGMQMVVVVELAVDHPWFLAFINVLKHFVKPGPDDKSGMGAVMGVAYKAINEKLQPGYDLKTSNDILSSWIRKGMTKEQCQDETMILILGGSDSTAQVIRSTFFHIVSAPLVYARLTLEIKTALDAGNVSSPIIRNSEAIALPYLQACIKEGLRVLQPLNGLQSKKAPPEGLVWKGYQIPGGTEVGVSQYTILRRKDVFGDDADMYRPERWLDNLDPAGLRNMQNVLGMAFGGGPGLCLGKNIALLELNKVIFELFRTFDFQLVNPLAEVLTQCRGIVHQQGMNIKAYPKRFA